MSKYVKFLLQAIALLCITLGVFSAQAMAKMCIRDRVTTGSLGAGFVGGLIAVLVFAAVIVTLIMRANRAIDTEYQLD